MASANVRLVRRGKTVVQCMQSCIECGLHNRTYEQGHALPKSSIRAFHASSSQLVSQTASIEETVHRVKTEEERLQLQLPVGKVANAKAIIFKEHDKTSQSSISLGTPVTSSSWLAQLEEFKSHFRSGDVSRPADSQQLTDVAESSTSHNQHPSLVAELLPLASLPDAATKQQPVPTSEPTPMSSRRFSAVVYRNEVVEEPERIVINKKRKEIDVLEFEEAMSQQLKHKLICFNQELLAYVDVCIQTGQVETACQLVVRFFLNCYSKRTTFINRRIRDAEIFNRLLEGLIQERKMERGLQIFQQMLHIGVSPNMTTYALLLRLAMSCDETCQEESLRQALHLINSQGIALENIVVDSNLRFDPAGAAEFIQKLRVFLPHINPKEVPRDNAYDNSLVNHLNQRKELHNPHSGVISKEVLQELLRDQMEREKVGEVVLQSIDPIHLDPSTRRKREQYEEVKKHWRESLHSTFLVELQHHQEKFDSADIELYPFLKLLSVDEYVALMLREAEKLSEMSELYSPSITLLADELGLRVLLKYITKRFDQQSLPEQMLDLFRKYIEASLAPTLRGCYRDIYTELDVQQKLLSACQAITIWPTWTNRMVGKLLYEVLLKSLKIPADVMDARPRKNPEYIPAFYTIHRMVDNKTCLQIKPHPSLIKLVVAAQTRRIILGDMDVPLKVPPMPWISQKLGCFITSRPELIRQQRGHFFGGKEDRQLLPVLDALNVLSACAWKVNKPVLELITNVFNSNGNEKLCIPCDPDTIKIPKLDRSLCPDEQAAIKLEREALKKKKCDMLSERTSHLISLSVANHFKDGVFWLPHNIDFRGRAYPLSMHYSHVGNDAIRSTMLFAKGKPLGVRGLEWLKIHLVNLTGLKKRETTHQRLAFSEEIIPLAIQSAEQPFEGAQWWQESGDPWQTLACCKELKAALDSGDPVNFVSHLPIHQDGSMNGLQHYAAMGRDQLGAVAVNVAPSEIPQDVYSGVAEQVEKIRQEDALSGVAIAKLLEGKINRKVVKQSVMTTVYGVTRFGVQRQIKKQLKEQFDMPDIVAYKAGNYLAARVIKAMERMFSSSTEIQSWLTLCAHNITSVCGQPVTWETPLGLPVTQNYWTLVRDPVADDGSRYEKPCAQKQKNAFPPNFIHSLDSTHMFLTALHCQQEGITFSSVHDCFWTHACDVDAMNRICREQFVQLYKQPILDSLRDYFLKTYVTDDPGCRFLSTVVSNIPPQGKFDLDSVLRSEYFFS